MHDFGFFEISSINNTRKFAELIASHIMINDCILIKGDLGSGKTTIASFIIKKLINNDQINITSPTFNIINTYNINRSKKIWHCDLYRIKNIIEIGELGLLEPLQNTILIIEWPELVENFYSSALMLKIEHIEQNRKIIATSREKKWIDFLQKIRMF